MRVYYPDDCDKSYENGWKCLTVDLHGTSFYRMRQACDTRTTWLTIHRVSKRNVLKRYDIFSEVHGRMMKNSALKTTTIFQNNVPFVDLP